MASSRPRAPERLAKVQRLAEGRARANCYFNCDRSNLIFVVLDLYLCIVSECSAPDSNRDGSVL